MKRSPMNQVSSKKLAENGGVMPFSTFQRKDPAPGKRRAPRAPIAQKSKKRKVDDKTRVGVCKIVLARDQVCRGRGLTPVECQTTATEVHEIYRGANRAKCWLNPELCLGLCNNCHRWVTDQPKLARPLGLALRTGDEVPEWIAKNQ